MRWIIVVICVVLTGCLKTEQRKVQAFYNVDSLVTAQVEALSAGIYTLKKTAGVQGEEETSESRPDPEQWERELSLFRTLDINEPRLVPLFMVSSETDMNGISITSYSSESPESTTVQWFKVRHEGENLVSIEAEIADSNPIYGNRRVIGMVFSKEEALKEYYIRGGEKLAVKDTVQYTLKAEIQREN